MNRPIDDDELIARAREAADHAAADLDAATRGRLSAARRRALEALEAPQPAALGGWRSGWMPAGAAATLALVAVGVALALRTPATSPETAAEPGTELEAFLAEDDPALYDEELEFYAWLDEQASTEPPDAG